jgi:hypothetical protein
VSNIKGWWLIVAPPPCNDPIVGARTPTPTPLFRNLIFPAVQVARQALNADTIREMHLAFRRGGRKAIDKVMKQQPAVFLKLLVLLVPREMKVEHTGGVKAMSDEQLEAGIEALTAMLAARDPGGAAQVIDAVPEPVALPAPARKAKRKVRRSDQVVGHVGTADESGNS